MSLMTDVLIREVCCSGCGRSTRHLATTFHRIGQCHIVSANGLSLNLGCAQCKKITRSQILPGAKLFEGVDLSTFPNDLIEYLVSLRCGRGGCNAPVNILMLLGRDFDPNQFESYVKGFESTDAVCFWGFPVASERTIITYERLT